MLASFIRLPLIVPVSLVTYRSLLVSPEVRSQLLSALSNIVDAFLVDFFQSYTSAHKYGEIKKQGKTNNAKSTHPAGILSLVTLLHSLSFSLLNLPLPPPPPPVAIEPPALLPIVPLIATLLGVDDPWWWPP